MLKKSEFHIDKKITNLQTFQVDSIGECGAGWMAARRQG